MNDTDSPPPGPCEYCGARGGEECIPYCVGTEDEEDRPMDQHTDQYRTLAPKRNPDSIMYHLPGGRFIAAQYNEESGRWDVVEYGHLWGQALERGLGQAEADMLAHGVRLLRLIELEA